MPQHPTDWFRRSAESAAAGSGLRRLPCPQQSADAREQAGGLHHRVTCIFIAIYLLSPRLDDDLGVGFRTSEILERPRDAVEADAARHPPRRIHLSFPDQAKRKRKFLR